MNIRKAFRTLAIAALGVGALLGLVSIARLPWIRIDWSDPVLWAQKTPSEDAVASLAWLATVLVIGYLVTSGLIYALASALEARRTLRAVRWMTILVIRHAVDTMVAVSVSAASFGAPAAVAAEPPSPLIYDIVDGIPMPRGETAGSADPETDDGRPTDIAPPGIGAAGYTPTAAGSGTEGPSGTTTEQATYLVEQGDSLWQIACRQIKAVENDPGLGEITAYWLRLIDANRNQI